MQGGRRPAPEIVRDALDRRRRRRHHRPALPRGQQPLRKRPGSGPATRQPPPDSALTGHAAPPAASYPSVTYKIVAHPPACQVGQVVGGRRYGGGQSASRTRQSGATDEAPGRAGTIDPVRELPDEGFRRARIESWTRDDLTIVREATGRELCPATRPGTPIPGKTARIVDRAVWVDGEGVAQGARTECVGWLADGAGDQAQSAEARLAPYGGSLQSG